jgi:hypothetical protein
MVILPKSGLNIGGTDNYDDNYSAPSSEDSIFPENEHNKNDPIEKNSLKI